MPLIAIVLMIFAWPFLEIAAFIAVGQEIGILPTIALTLFSSAVGAALLRQQGLAILRTVQSEIAQRRVPTSALGHGALITMAGCLLLVPGFVSDFVGLLLFIPPLRSVILRALARNIDVVVVGSSTRRRKTVVDLDRADWETKSSVRPSRLRIPADGPASETDAT